MTTDDSWVHRDELLVTATEAIAAALLTAGLPPLEVRPLPHDLAAVLVPHGLTASQETAMRAALGLPIRTGRRQSSPQPPATSTTRRSA